MANKALFWYNYKRFVDEGTIKPLSPKTFALSGLITVCGLVLSLTIYCLVFPNSFVGENTPIKLFLCTLFYMLGTLAMIGGVYFWYIRLLLQGLYLINYVIYPVNVKVQ